MYLRRLPEFQQWISELSPKTHAQMEARLLRIQDHDHFGDARYLGDGLAELRWKNGLRVYFSKIEDDQGNAVLLILGGTKHGQSKDIAKARILLRTYSVQKAPARRPSR